MFSVYDSRVPSLAQSINASHKGMAVKGAEVNQAASNHLEIYTRRYVFLGYPGPLQLTRAQSISSQELPRPLQSTWVQSKS